MVADDIRIRRTGGAQGPSAIRRKDRPGAKAGDFASHLVDAVDAGVATAETAAVPSVDNVLAVQEVGGEAGRRQLVLAREYADDLLAGLDRLRLDILAGAIGKEALIALAQTVRARRRRSDDPRLNAILEEIELRCEVEIAKYTRPAAPPESA